ncbi:hypothetical protein L1N85_26820, partial [Paenibacillus alkaliterrae]|uniref:hypothetical protein n=1 Tax=Paenibacillus alkaliterrae TaxID=320909 RepID=UPI001F34207D
YSFDIGYEVRGTNVHTLANKSTSTTATADSYYFNYNVHPQKDNYSVQLYKSWTSYYTVSNLIANGTTQTKNFGIISAGNYTINVTKNGDSADKIVGSGTINQ